MIRKRKKVLITIIVVLALLFVTIIYTYKEENKTHLTVYEALERGAGNVLQNGTSFHIRDKVIQTNIIYLPETSELLYNYTVYPNKTKDYTVVFFESVPQSALLFIGNRTSEFPENSTVEFTLVAQRYETEKPDGSLVSIYLTEPTYAWMKVMDIIGALINNKFSFVSFDINYRENSTLILTVKDIFLPTPEPIQWSTVRAYEVHSYPRKYLNMSLFSSDGSFLGTLKDGNESIDAVVHLGDYLVIKNITENATIYVEGDAFSSFDSPATYPDTNDFFHMQLLTVISLKPQEVTE